MQGVRPRFHRGQQRIRAPYQRRPWQWQPGCASRRLVEEFSSGADQLQLSSMKGC